MLPDKYIHENIQQLHLEDDLVFFRLLNLPEDIQEYAVEIYTNLPVAQDEIDDILEVIREDPPNDMEVPQYIMVIVDIDEKSLSAYAFCSMCVYRKMFEMGMHPENCSDENVLDAVLEKYLDFMEGVEDDHH